MRQLSRLRWLRRLWQVRWLSLVRQLRLWLVAIAGPKFVKIVVGPDAGRDDTRRGQIRLVAISAGDRLKAGFSDVGKAPRDLGVGRLLDTLGKGYRRVSPAQHIEPQAPFGCGTGALIRGLAWHPHRVPTRSP